MIYFQLKWNIKWGRGLFLAPPFICQSQITSWIHLTLITDAESLNSEPIVVQLLLHTHTPSGSGSSMESCKNTHMKWMSLVCSGWNQSSEIKLGVSVTLLDSGLNPSGWFSRVLQLWPLGNTSMSSVWSCVWLRFFMLRPKEKDSVRQERVFLILNN